MSQRELNSDLAQRSALDLEDRPDLEELPCVGVRERHRAVSQVQQPPAATADSLPGLLAPTNTAPPVVSGNPTQGQTLNTTNGSWANLPTSYAYAWQDCDTAGNSCATISGATTSSYTLTAADAGHTIRSVVTASNLLGSGTASSNPTATVVPLPPANTAAAGRERHRQRRARR